MSFGSMESYEVQLGDCEIALREANYDSEHKRFSDRRVLANSFQVVGASSTPARTPTFQIPKKPQMTTTSETKKEVEDRKQRRDLLWSRLSQMVRRDEEIEERIRKQLKDERMKLTQRK